MSNLLRILLFVPPMFLLVLPSFGQLSGTIEQNPSNNTYTVSVIPSVTWSGNQAITSGAGITLRAATGKLQLSNFQTITGQWASTGVFVAPSEAPGYDYFTFGLLQLLPNATYTTGVSMPLFSFKNSLGCAAIEIIDNQTDPLNIPNNSINIAVENYFSVVGAGNGVNAYADNAAQDFIGCPPLALSVAPAINPLPCHGDATFISVAVSGGQEPYTVTWVNQNTGATSSAPISIFEGSLEFPGMVAGDYIFTVVDNLDSTSVTNVVLSQPSQPLHIELRADAASCNGSFDGNVEVEKAVGGTVSGSYQYNWEGYPSVIDSIMEMVNPGAYSVTVTDDNGCTATGTAVVDAYAVIFPNPIIKDVRCNGAENGIIDLYPVSPNPPYTYQWSSNVTTGNFSSAWQLGPGTYSVTVTDATGVCNEVATYTISEPPAIEVDYRVFSPKCYGEMGLLEIMGISNSQGAWEAEIIGGASVKEGDNFQLEPGIPLRLVVEDSKGCMVAEDFVVAAKQELKLEIGESQDIKYGQQVQFDPVYFPKDNVSFEWSTTDGLSCSDCPDPLATPTETTTYRLQMTDTAGCTIEDYVNIAVRKSRDIFIPNSFSPNHDGINDSFYPYGGFEIVAVHSMQVYDRWGGKMFEHNETFMPNDANAGWNGFTKDKPADPGTYLYTMNVEFIDGEIILFSGELNLMR